MNSYSFKNKTLYLETSQPYKGGFGIRHNVYHLFDLRKVVL